MLVKEVPGITKAPAAMVLTQFSALSTKWINAHQERSHGLLHNYNNLDDFVCLTAKGTHKSIHDFSNHTNVKCLEYGC